MCGRIAQVHTAEELQDLLGITVGAEVLTDVHVSYNVPPSARLPTLVSDQGWTGWCALTWGFRPAWTKKGPPMINVRSETVREKRMFIRAIRHRRCIVVASAYYEWLPTPSGKQPFCIRSARGLPLLMAGIYENGTCAIMTRAARGDLSYIHDRMPVLISRALLEPYLTDYRVLPEAIAFAEALPLHAYKVTRQVGNPRFSGPECMEPLAA